jgi:hypothetical protein
VGKDKIGNQHIWTPKKSNSAEKLIAHPEIRNCPDHWGFPAIPGPELTVYDHNPPPGNLESRPHRLKDRLDTAISHIRPGAADTVDVRTEQSPRYNFEKSEKR